MTDANSTMPALPAKPHPDFPLFPHRNGTWAKKIRGKLHYFGPWADPDAALAKYLEQKEALHSGRTPRPEPGAVTVKDVCNYFLNHKEALLKAGELSPRTWGQYKGDCDLLVKHFGKARLVADLGPEDFASLRAHMASRWGHVSVGNTISRVRGIFRLADEDGLIERIPRCGQSFKPPSRKTLRISKARQGPKLFSKEEIHRLLAEASVFLRAMILLGINAGLGNADCGRLPQSALDLEAGWLDYPRVKTGIPRRCWLWPETVAAIKEALACRPEPKDPDDADLVFLTRWGNPWHNDSTESPVSYRFGKLLHRLGINGRMGRGFYTLRHTFRTVADEARDQPAADYIMGHARGDMASVYRERISDARLRTCSATVRGWLFNTGEKPGESSVQ
jgi:integrase